MKKALLPAVLILFGLILAGCGSPPPLRSDKYLDDQSFLTQKPCGSPCYQNITLGQTTFADAVTKVKANPLFSDVQTQDNPPQASWKTAGGELCCQMQANDKGIVFNLLIRLAPKITTKQIVDVYGPPDYVLPQDYTDDEVALGLVYPKLGNVVWVVPGNASSTLAESSPAVLLLYIDPANFSDAIAVATLQGWAGYKEYKAYKQFTPVVTPRVTLTPAQ